MSDGLCKVISSAILAALAFCPACSDQPPPKEASSSLAFPDCDLILISIDTLRADRLPAYGNDQVSTPFLDGLEAEGVLLQNCHTQAMVTAPSHMTMMTSTYPRVHKVKNLGSLKNPVYFALPPTIETLAEVLRKAGYRTAAFTDGGNVSPYLGFDRGFEEYDARNEGIFFKVHRAHDFLKDRAPKERLFLFLHTYEVHDYLNAEEFAKVRFDPEAGASLLQEVEALAAYDDRIENCDRALGWLFEKMKLLSRFESSLILVTSDHGESFYEHGYLGHLQFFRETSHVPLFMRLPRGAEGGRKIGTPCGLVDLMPTLLELMGLDGPEGMQGRSLACAIQGEAMPDLPVFGDRIGPDPAYSILLDGHKLIKDPLSRPEIHALFRLEGDPGEERDLRDEKGTMLERLERIAQEHLQRSARLADEYGSGKSTRLNDPELIEKLKQLGY